MVYLKSNLLMGHSPGGDDFDQIIGWIASEFKKSDGIDLKKTHGFTKT